MGIYKKHWVDKAAENSTIAGTRFFTRDRVSCVLFKGAKVNGYAKMRIDGKPELLHRMAYIEYHGPIPEGAIVVHTCGNRHCWEPNHLTLKTRADASPKTESAIKAKHATKTKLNERDAATIRMMLSSKLYTHKEIAEKYHISTKQVQNIKSGKSWGKATAKILHKSTQKPRKSQGSVYKPTQKLRKSQGSVYKSTQKPRSAILRKR